MVSKIKLVDELSPDGSSRFFIMVSLLNILNNKNKTIKLLDVGGSSPYMASALNSLNAPFEISVIDILPKPEHFKGEYIQGDALNMPFADNSFDTVISTDVLEHIPYQNKIDFVHECLRVAKNYVIIAAPFDSDAVDAAEHATNDLNVKLFDVGQSWLEEHFEYKKPNLDNVLQAINKKGYEAEVVGSNNLYNWILSTHLNLVEAKLGLDSKKLININKLFNKSLLTSNDMSPPFYRHFVVVSKKNLSIDKKEKIDALRNPSVSHKESIIYIHSLLTLVAEKMKESDIKMKQLEKTSNSEVYDLNKQIDNLKSELADKQSIIDKCRPYIYLLNGGPFSKIGRGKKSKKQI